MRKEYAASTRVSLLTLLTLLSVASISIALPSTEPARLAAYPEALALALAALPLGYRALLRRDRPLARPGQWLLAVLFAGVVTLAQGFAAVGTTEPLFHSPLARFMTCLYFAGRVPLYYMAMTLFERALSRDVPFPSAAGQDARAGQGGLLSRFRDFAERRQSLAVFTVLLLACWLPYYVCTFPGTVSNDSITQLKEIYHIKPLSAGNPLAQTFLLAAFCELGRILGSADAAVALYCAAQAILMALLFAYAVRLMLRSDAPAWLAAVSLGFFALCPVFPVFALCVGKDTNFAMAVLFFSLMVWQTLRLPQDSPLPRRYAAGLCVSAALLPLLRNPGGYPALLTLAVLLAWTLRKSRRAAPGKLWRAPVCALVTLGVVWAALAFALPLLTGAEPMPETEESSLPLQQVARVVATNPESLTAKEREAIGGALDFERIKTEYNGELSDPIKDLWDASASPEKKSAFFEAWLSLLRKHPMTCFSATFHNVYGYLTPGYVSVIKPTLLIGKQGRTTELDPYFAFSINPRAEALKTVTDALTDNSLSRLLIAPGLYGWLTLFALMTVARSRQKKLLCAAFPALFTLAGCLLSAVNGYFRYAMPLYFCAPLLVVLCANALRPSPAAPQEPKE